MSSLWGYIFGANEKKVNSYVIDDLPSKPQDTLAVEDFEPSSEDEWCLVGETDSVSSTDNIVAFVPTLDSRQIDFAEDASGSLDSSLDKMSRSSSLFIIEECIDEEIVEDAAVDLRLMEQRHQQEVIAEIFGQTTARPAWQNKAVITKRSEVKREKKRRDKITKQPQQRNQKQTQNHIKMHWNAGRTQSSVSRKQQKSF